MQAKAVLQSWKEISAHVRRTERTLQRWEQDFGFPVHRPSGKPRSAVIAVVSEIEEWMRAKPSLPAIQKSARLRLWSAVHRNGVSTLGTAVSHAFSCHSSEHATSEESYQLRLAVTVEEFGILRLTMRNLIAEQKRLREDLSQGRKNLERTTHELRSVLRYS
jgi:hypothetical protein